MPGTIAGAYLLHALLWLHLGKAVLEGLFQKLVVHSQPVVMEEDSAWCWGSESSAGGHNCFEIHSVPADR